MPKTQDCRLGKWKKTEHDRFMKALSKYGKNWSLIQKAVKTRTLAQVRSHSQKLFLSMTSKQISVFQEEINRRFESFCSTNKHSENSKKEQGSAVKGQFAEQQEQKSSLQYQRNKQDLMSQSRSIKINEQERNAVQESKQSKKDFVKVESSCISQVKMMMDEENIKLASSEENMRCNFMMVPYPQMMTGNLGNFQYYFWLPC